MQLQFVGKNIEITPALKSTTAERFKALEKRFHQITNVNIVFYVEHNLQIIEATLRFNGSEIHAKGENKDMYKAIDLLLSKLSGQLNKHKQKTINSHR